MWVIKDIAHQSVMDSKAVFEILSLESRVSDLFTDLRLDDLYDGFDLCQVEVFPHNEKIDPRIPVLDEYSGSDEQLYAAGAAEALGQRLIGLQA